MSWKKYPPNNRRLLKIGGQLHCLFLILFLLKGNCPNDCIDIRNCQQALDLAKGNKSNAVIDKIKRAHCGGSKVSSTFIFLFKSLDALLH